MYLLYIIYFLVLIFSLFVYIFVLLIKYNCCLNNFIIWFKKFNFFFGGDLCFSFLVVLVIFFFVFIISFLLYFKECFNIFLFFILFGIFICNLLIVIVLYFFNILVNILELFLLNRVIVVIIKICLLFYKVEWFIIKFFNIFGILLYCIG